MERRVGPSLKGLAQALLLLPIVIKQVLTTGAGQTGATQVEIWPNGCLTHGPPHARKLPEAWEMLNSSNPKSNDYCDGKDYFQTKDGAIIQCNAPACEFEGGQRVLARRSPKSSPKFEPATITKYGPQRIRGPRNYRVVFDADPTKAVFRCKEDIRSIEEHYGAIEEPSEDDYIELARNLIGAIEELPEDDATSIEQVRNLIGAIDDAIEDGHIEEVRNLHDAIEELIEGGAVEDGAIEQVWNVYDVIGERIEDGAIEHVRDLFNEFPYQEGALVRVYKDDPSQANPEYYLRVITADDSMTADGYYNFVDKKLINALSLDPQKRPYERTISWNVCPELVSLRLAHSTDGHDHRRYLADLNTYEPIQPTDI